MGDKDGARTHLEMVLSGEPCFFRAFPYPYRPPLSFPSFPPPFDPIETGRRGMLTQLRTGKPLEVAPGARKVRLICVLAFGCEDAADEVRFPFDRWRRSVG